MEDLKKEIGTLLKEVRDWIEDQPDPAESAPNDAQCDAVAGFIERAISLFKRVK